MLVEIKFKNDVDSLFINTDNITHIKVRPKEDSSIYEVEINLVGEELPLTCHASSKRIALKTVNRLKTKMNEGIFSKITDEELDDL